MRPILNEPIIESQIEEEDDPCIINDECGDDIDNVSYRNDPYYSNF